MRKIIFGLLLSAAITGCGGSGGGGGSVAKSCDQLRIETVKLEDKLNEEGFTPEVQRECEKIKSNYMGMECVYQLGEGVEEIITVDENFCADDPNGGEDDDEEGMQIQLE